MEYSKRKYRSLKRKLRQHEQESAAEQIVELQDQVEQFEQVQQQQQPQQQPPARLPSVYQPMRTWSANACRIIGVTYSQHRAPDCSAVSTKKYKCSHCTRTFEKNQCLNAYISHLKEKHHEDLRDLQMTLNHRQQYLPVRLLSQLINLLVCQVDFMNN